jgi:hypothetical protein
LILDEIILYHNKKARKYYEACKKKYPEGVLEIIYKRKEDRSYSDGESTTSSATQSPEELVKKERYINK